MTHICVGETTIIGSDNGLSPGRRQAIIWTNAGILLIGPLETNFIEISIGIQTFSFNKMHLKVSSAKWRPFCLGLNVLISMKCAATSDVWWMDGCKFEQTRRSENENNTQPIDQRIDSSLMDSQDGNCNSFASTHYSCICHGLLEPTGKPIVQVQGCIVGPTSYWIHIPFIPCQSATPLRGCSFFKIWLWKSKVKVIAQGHIVGSTSYWLTSLSFHVNRPTHPQLFQKLAFMVQGQGHGWGKNSNSQSESDFLLTHNLTSLSFHVNQSSHSWDMAFSDSTLKILCQGHSSRSHSGSNIFSTLISLKCSMWVDPLIPEIQLFQNLTLKIQGQGHGRVHSSKPQSVSHFLLFHIPFIFHVNRPSYSCDIAFSTFDLANPSSRS